MEEDRGMMALARAGRDLPRLDAAEACREVPEELLRRHLGLPPEAPLEETHRTLLESARARFEKCASAWAAVSRYEIETIRGDEIRLEGGGRLLSPVLAEGLRTSRAHAIAISAVTAGCAVDEEIDRLWKADLPDESLFLHAYAVAAVEHLRASAARLLADHLARGGENLLPHTSPGYPGWDLAGQASLLALLPGGGPIRALDSGGLAPQRSTTAAHGVTRLAAAGGAGDPRPCAEAPAGAAPTRSFPPRALAKWSRDRLRVTPLGDGRLQADFRFDGTTCSSLGMPLAFDYTVTLRPAGGERLAVESCSARPAAGDRGHRSMCAFRSDSRKLLREIEEPPPWIGLPLDEAAASCGEVSSSGCLCLPGYRAHKWKMVLETICYTLPAGRFPAAEEQGSAR
jgi:hypothetical protein